MARAAEVQQEEPPGQGYQLSRRESVFWYGLATVTYVGAAVVEKGLLNWFVGPLWLVSFIWFGPQLADRVRRRFRRR